MTANVETMFSVREKPWHGLGAIVMDAPTSADALRLAELVWKVVQEPVYTGYNEMVKGYKANVRSSDRKVLGVVSDRYKVVQNVDALQEMKIVMEELARQIQSAEFSLSNSGYDDLKRDYLALVLTVVDIVNGAAYLFEKETCQCRKDKKAEQKLGQLRYALENSGDSS